VGIRTHTSWSRCYCRQYYTPLPRCPEIRIPRPYFTPLSTSPPPVQASTIPPSILSSSLLVLLVLTHILQPPLRLPAYLLFLSQAPSCERPASLPLPNIDVNDTPPQPFSWPACFPDNIFRPFFFSLPPLRLRPFRALASSHPSLSLLKVIPSWPHERCHSLCLEIWNKPLDGLRGTTPPSEKTPPLLSNGLACKS